MNTAALVIAVVLAIAVLLALLALPLLLLKRRSQRQAAQLTAEFAGSQLARGPEQASYRGGTADYPAVKGNCLLALTPEHLIWQMLVGKRLDIALRDITGIREDKVFRGSVHAGRTHLIITTAAGEVGFFTGDNAGWLTAIEAAR